MDFTWKCCKADTCVSPPASLVTRMCYKIADVLNSVSDEERKEEEGEDLITVQILSEFGMYTGLGSKFSG